MAKDLGSILSKFKELKKNYGEDNLRKAYPAAELCDEKIDEIIAFFEENDIPITKLNQVRIVDDPLDVLLKRYDNLKEVAAIELVRQNPNVLSHLDNCVQIQSRIVRCIRVGFPYINEEGEYLSFIWDTEEWKKISPTMPTENIVDAEIVLKEKVRIQDEKEAERKAQKAKEKLATQTKNNEIDLNEPVEIIPHSPGFVDEETVNPNFEQELDATVETYFNGEKDFTIDFSNQSDDLTPKANDLEKTNDVRESFLEASRNLSDARIVDSEPSDIVPEQSMYPNFSEDKIDLNLGLARESLAAEKEKLLAELNAKTDGIIIKDDEIVFEDINPSELRGGRR